MTQIRCNTDNYRKGRRLPIKYLVLHYTAGRNDTAENNGYYFKNNKNLNASAHYFVDDNKAICSVEERDTAWHCGASSYMHPECRNDNSIGIEMCTTYKEGVYSISEKTAEQAVKLAKEVMQRNKIRPENVLRHYDVTGKSCPAPWVTNNTPWIGFLERIKEVDGLEATRYNTLVECPEWAKATIEKLIDKGILNGTDEGLNLSMDMIRMFVINERAGIYD